MGGKKGGKTPKRRKSLAPAVSGKGQKRTYWTTSRILALMCLSIGSQSEPSHVYTEMS